MEGYKNSLEHLMDELKRIELKVRLQVLKFRMAGPASPDEFRGFCIKDEEIDALLDHQDPFETALEPEPSQFVTLRNQLASLGAGISQRKTKSSQAGITLRLQRLQELFQLSSFDVDVLLVGLAPEIDLKYEKFYAYLQDNLTRKRPTVDLVLGLLCSSVEEKLVTRQRFSPRAPLIWSHLISLFAELTERTSPFLAYHVTVDERVIHYLLGSDQLDARLLHFVQWADLDVHWRDLVLPESPKARLEQLVGKHLEDVAHSLRAHGRPEGLILYLQGPTGAGKRTTALALCRQFGIPLLIVDAEQLLHGELSIEIAARLLFREALLQQAALYLDHFDLLLGEDHKVRQCRETLIRELENLSGLTFLGGRDGWELAGLSHRRNFVRVDFTVPPYALRKELWKTSLESVDASSIDVDGIANKFRLCAGQIRNAVTIARNAALWRDPTNGRITSQDVYDACRSQSNQRLGTLAQKIVPKYAWNDIVLGKEQTLQLRELISYVRHRHVVYGEWGFDQKFSLGKGLNILFSGSSGTGKTMAAEILARELGLELFKIDLSMVVSKYIGETEKNLSRIFQEAQHSDAILFFDEADALFGKRSEVKDAHDRYANIEIAYLLQRMDEYDGIVILATNLRNNMDEAFTRRMHATIDFPFPEEEYRRRIFEGIFPKQAPLSREIDFAFLARQFKLTGGNIKNIALHAAFMAAEDGNVIGMTQLIRATKREFQKMGRVCGKAEFGPYYELVKGE